jgi:hypothetical protein
MGVKREFLSHYAKWKREQGLNRSGKEFGIYFTRTIGEAHNSLENELFRKDVLPLLSLYGLRILRERSHAPYFLLFLFFRKGTAKNPMIISV